MSKNDILYEVKNNLIQTMQTAAENLLNRHRYHLSDTARKRLRWMHTIYRECDDNVTMAANKIGISREWLSKLKSKFENYHKDPRSLEPESRTPRDTSCRKRISPEIEEKILEIRDEYGWGKEDISVVLERDHQLEASPSTVNRYLHKHHRIDPKISEKNKKSWEGKEKRKRVDLTIKFRPPKDLKDYAPGALVEKDMKLVEKPVKSKKRRLKEYFNYQHTFIDSFTRIRSLGITDDPNSFQAMLAMKESQKRMPFRIAGLNTDNGGENGKYFKHRLEREEILHFYSRTGTPIDNPRVERSHLTDDREFYNRNDNRSKSLTELKEALKKWEYTYNYLRPHQALGYLTPIEFYHLWKKDPDEAYRIKDKYRAYLARQRKRLANSRRIKKKEQIEKVMQFIDAKLKKNINLEPYKYELIKCELCSWT